jgi:GT2 family glycosyltransferase
MPHYIATEELVQLATNAIKSMKESDVFIVSVDDGSPMDTAFLDDISDHVIHLKKNSGFAIACNTGIHWALEQGAEYIGQANNDIEVFDGYLEALMYPYSKWDDVGITGLISSKLRILHNTPIDDYIVPKITDGGLLNHWMMSGGLWLSTAEVLKRVGLFDEQFKIGGEEDVDLFIRIREAGYKMVMSGYSCFWHKEGATRWNEEIQPGFRARNKALEEKNYDRFAKKWGYDIRTDGLRFAEQVIEENGTIVEQ